MTILANYPIVQPSLNLDFAHSGGVLDPRVTFSRSTTAPYYDGKTSALAEQNLLLQSQALTNATYWVTVNSSVTGNSTTAPDGTTTANTITDNATNGGHRVYQGGGNLSSATALTASAYFLQGTGTFGQLGLYDGSAYRTVTANLSTGVITETFGTATSTITALSGGWYRLTLSFTGGSSNATLSIGLSNTGTPNGLASYVGTGSTIYAWNAQLEQRSSATAYNATTTSALTNYIPQLLTAPINQPRFDFNPTTGESLGLLIEQSSTNLSLYSQSFDNAYWNKANATITTGADIAPDGTQTMQLFVPNNGATIGSGTNFSKSVTLSAGSVALSIYAKAKELTTFVLQDGSGQGSQFNVSTGVIVGNIGSGIGSITPVGNGVYRCIVTIASANANPNYFFYPTTGTANGYNGIYIWQAQLEALAFATSPIPTTSAQVTRGSDNESMTGTNFSSWFNQGQGTLYVESNSYYYYTANFQNIATLWGGNSSTSITLAAISYRFTSLINASQVSYYLTTPTANVFYKNVLTFNQTTALLVSSNNLGNSASPSVPLPTVTALYLMGNGQSTAFMNNGYIKKLAYYPQALTSAQLQALTGS